MRHQEGTTTAGGTATETVGPDCRPRCERGESGQDDQSSQAHSDHSHHFRPTAECHSGPGHLLGLEWARLLLYPQYWGPLCAHSGPDQSGNLGAQYRRDDGCSCGSRRCLSNRHCTLPEPSGAHCSRRHTPCERTLCHRPTSGGGGGSQCLCCGPSSVRA